MKQQIISWKWRKSIVKAEAKNWRDLRVAPRLGERAQVECAFPAIGAKYKCLPGRGSSFHYLEQ